MLPVPSPPPSYEANIQLLSFAIMELKVKICGSCSLTLVSMLFIHVLIIIYLATFLWYKVCIIMSVNLFYAFGLYGKKEIF